jgi:hypothetical protein
MLGMPTPLQPDRIGRKVVEEAERARKNLKVKKGKYKDFDCIRITTTDLEGNKSVIYY